MSNTDPATVVFVQRRLRELGYTEAGETDGDFGQMTKDAVLVFRARNNLPLSTEIDADFEHALQNASPKAIPIEQATAEVAHVAERVEAVNLNWWSRLWAKVLTIPSFSLSVLLLIVQNVGEASDKLVPVRNFLTNVPLWVWPLLIIPVALLIGYTTKLTQAALVAGYQQGTVREDLTSQKASPVPSGILTEVKV